MRVWTTKKTRDQGVAEWNRVVPVYKEWAKSHSVMDVAALDQHPQGTLIKQGRDLSLLYDRWIEIYGTWRLMAGREKWNHITSKHSCSGIQWLNIFTRECNDLPDWRTADQRADDAKVLAEYEERDAEAARVRKGN